MLLLMLMESVSFSPGAGWTMYHNTTPSLLFKMMMMMTMRMMMMMMIIVRLVRYGHGDRCVGDDYCMLFGYILGAAMSRNNSLHDMFRVQSAKMSTFGCNC